MKKVFLFIAFLFFSGCSSISQENLKPINFNEGKKYIATEDMAVSFGASKFYIKKGQEYISDFERRDINSAMLRIDDGSQMYIEVDSNGVLLNQNVCGFSVGSDMRCLGSIEKEFVGKKLFETSNASQKNLGLKNLVLGMSHEKMRVFYKSLYCSSTKEGNAVCNIDNHNNIPKELQNFYNEPIVKLYISFSNDKLSYISATTGNYAFFEIAKNIQAKYGKYTKEETVTKQNLMGAKFVGKELSWVLNDGIIILRQYAERYNDMEIVFIAKEEK